MLTTLLRRSKLATRLRSALRRDADEAMKPLRKELRRLAGQVEALQAQLEDTALRVARGDRYSSQVRLVLELNEQQRDLLAAAPALLDERQIRAHVCGAIGAAVLVGGNALFVRVVGRSDPLLHLLEGTPTVLVQDGQIDMAAVHRLGLRPADVVAAVARVDDVVAARAGDRVITGGPGDRVGLLGAGDLREAGQGVALVGRPGRQVDAQAGHAVARLEPDLVEVRPTDEGVGPEAAVQRVVAGAAVDGVVPAAAGQHVVALPEGDRYLGFVFARDASADAVERALRAAWAALDIEVIAS